MADTRRRMVEATAALVRQRGYAGTSLSDILEASGAPRGSLYHHFPGGKDELVLEATRSGVGRLTRALDAAMAAADEPADGFSAYLDAAAAELAASDFALGCPVASVVLDDPAPDSALAAACTAAFEAWERIYARRLVDAGVPPERADELATLLVAGVEGALLLARARRDTEPLRSVKRELERAVRAAARAPA